LLRTLDLEERVDGRRRELLEVDEEALATVRQVRRVLGDEPGVIDAGVPADRVAAQAFSSALRSMVPT